MFETLHFLCLAIAACALIVAAVHDVRSYEIPDSFSIRRTSGSTTPSSSALWEPPF